MNDLAIPLVAIILKICVINLDEDMPVYSLNINCNGKYFKQFLWPSEKAAGEK